MCKELLYQGDTLDREGGAGPAATARISNGWMDASRCWVKF